MDRSVIDIWRAKEKDFSDILYQKLEILTVIHPPSKEFQRIFTEDMFIKPNQKAFFHVMHYLFVLLDPNEFKKRFYWPVCDKKAETSFRSSTVLYINHLIEKHNLNWTHITNYLVVMPGGSRFISFLIDFTDFVVDELTRRTEKEVFEQLGVKIGKDEPFCCETLKKKSESFQAHCSRYAEQIDKATNAINKSTADIKAILEEIAASVGIDIEQLMQPDFLKEFNTENWNMFQNEFTSDWDELKEINNSLNKLKEKIEQFLNRNSEVSYDKDALLRSYKLIQSDADHQKLFPKNELNIETLIKAFCKIIPTIDKTLNEMQQKSTDNLELQCKEVEKLSEELMQVKADMVQFGDSVRKEMLEDVKKTPNRTKFPLENDLRTKFINTPPISFDFDHARVKNPRLPLLDDYVPQQESFSFTDQTTLLHHKSSKSDSQRSAVKNKTKIVDPFTILRTVKKYKPYPKEKSNSLIALASEWKERELMLDSEKEDLKPSSVVSPVKTLQNCHFDSMNSTVPSSSNIQQHAKLLTSTKKISEMLTPLATENVSYQKRNLSNSLIYEPFDAFDFVKASTSPSGRLDSLVKVDSKDVPKIFLTEKALFEGKPPEPFLSDNSPEVLDSVENVSASTNLSSEFDKKLDLLGNNDLIFDVSDTVLRDVPT